MATATHATAPSLEIKSLLALEGEEGFVPMQPDEECELGRRVRSGDSEAAWTLVMANQNFVRAIARRYRRDGLDLEDLVAEGLLGLMDAAQRFDPDRGIKFITYGVWWVKRSILRYLRCFEHPVHVPKYKQYEMQEFWRLQRRLANELGRPPSKAELAEAAGTTERQVSEFLGLSSRHDCLDDESCRSAERLRRDDPDPEEHAVLASCRDRLREILDVLDARERRIVSERFGLDGAAVRTLSAIGEELGLTKERIRQIERAACRKLRSAIEAPAAKAAPVPARAA